MSRVLSILALLATVVAPSSAQAQTCGLPAGGTITGVVNTYYPGVGTLAAGGPAVVVDTAAVRGAVGTPIVSGDLLLVMQMQDADINATNNNNYGANNGTGRGATFVNNSGVYEYVVATSNIVAGAITIVGSGGGNGLINSYRTLAATATAGQRTYQVIRVPQYSSATLGAALSASAWDGRTGGVLAVDVSGTLTLTGGTATVDGLGFRGAAGRSLAGDAAVTGTDYVSLSTNNAHGGKGEGIAGTPAYVWSGAAVVNTGVEGYPSGSMARGAPATAGGGGTDPHPTVNDENGGGGGGANAGDGGQGGNSWSSNLARGGLGGVALGNLSPDHLILGGGGGAGDSNNCGPSHGGAGGGIVLFRVGAVAGAGTMNARGLMGLTSGQDGAGGGGAGGRIVVLAATGNLNGLTANVAGGNGGYTNLNVPPAPAPAPGCMAGTSHGPGGGGGGGAAFLSSAPTAAPTVAGGTFGLTNVNAGANTTPTTNYNATAGGAGFTNSAVTLGQLPGVQPCTTATRASICGLRVDPAGTVEFATSSQRGTLAFNLYATSDRTGRERTAITDRPILSPVPSSNTPILYHADTAPITEPYVVLEEVEVSGHRRALGPFPVGDEVLRLGYERIEKRAGEAREDRRGHARLFSSRLRARDERMARRPAHAPERGRGRRADEGLSLVVSRPGPVLVSLADLVAAGLPAAGAMRPDTLRLANLGRPVPFQVTLGDGGAPSLRFQADALATDYTDDNVYVLSWGRGLPPAPAVPLTRSGFPRLPGFVRVEQNVFYAGFVAQGSDPWVWDLLVSGQPAGPYEFDLPRLAAAGGNVPVRIGVVGGSAHTHVVDASLNGYRVGSVTLKGTVAATLVGTVPASALAASGNRLDLTYTVAEPPASDEDVGLLFLDVVDLGVPVAPPVDRVPVDRISAYDSTLPTLTGADYLIVTHAAFGDQARRIAALKEAEGHRTVVVDVQNAYDRFSSGVMEAASVQALIRQAARGGTLKYVLLVGDDTVDPRDFSGAGQVAYVPSLDGWDGQFGRVPSENRYADLDGDGRPDVAIGRLPVQTPEDADVLVDKISRQSDVLKAAGARHLIAVDNEGPGDVSFSGEARHVAAMLPPGSATTWADIGTGLDGARATLRAGLDEGALTTSYFGHGSQDFWADEKLFTSEDAAGLAPNGRETVLFAWTCESQNYQFLYGPSLAESLLLAPQAGALAAVGPTGITDPLPQAALYDRVYRYFFRGLSLGESLRRAKAEALKANPQSRSVVEGWSLLGDPSLTLPRESSRP